MTEFRVTRELAQELAEVGAVQLPKEFTPPFDDFFQTGFKKVETDSEDNTIPVTLKQLSTYSFWEVVAELAKLDRTPLADVSLSCEARNGIWISRRIHQDSNCKLDNVWFYPRLSFIWMPNANDDTLRTYGRGKNPAPFAETSLRYASGPIVLAQEGYGERLVSASADLERTWHVGQGSSTGEPFFGLDILSTGTRRV